jgi:hypothetical protein
MEMSDYRGLGNKLMAQSDVYQQGQGPMVAPGERMSMVPQAISALDQGLTIHATALAELAQRLEAAGVLLPVGPSTAATGGDNPPRPVACSLASTIGMQSDRVFEASALINSLLRRLDV